MGKYLTKPVVVEAMTWDEVIEEGKKQDPKAVEEYGMPWAFEIKGNYFTHEDDEQYLIAGEGIESLHLSFTPSDVVTWENGESYVYRKDVFDEMHDLQKEETFYDGLVKQQLELQDKIMKLGIFIAAGGDKKASIFQGALMRTQLKAMKTYHQCLTERIDDLGRTKKEN